MKRIPTAATKPTPSHIALVPKNRLAAMAIRRFSLVVARCHARSSSTNIAADDAAKAASSVYILVECNLA